MTSIHLGATHHGMFGTAQRVLAGPDAPPEWSATVALWMLDCPGQSPAWRHYLLSVVHLRPVDDLPPAAVTVPGATHELIVCALDPMANPRPLLPGSWVRLTPTNVVEQVQLPDDETASVLADLAARAVVDGTLPAEPPLAGAREPWRTALIKTSAHLRGEPHAV